MAINYLAFWSPRVRVKACCCGRAGGKWGRKPLIKTKLSNSVYIYTKKMCQLWSHMVLMTWFITFILTKYFFYIYRCLKININQTSRRMLYIVKITNMYTCTCLTSWIVCNTFENNQKLFHIFIHLLKK